MIDDLLPLIIAGISAGATVAMGLPLTLQTLGVCNEEFAGFAKRLAVLASIFHGLAACRRVVFL